MPRPQGLELVTTGPHQFGSSPLLLQAASDPWSWCLSDTRSIKPGACPPTPTPRRGDVGAARANHALASIPGHGELEGTRVDPWSSPRTPLLPAWRPAASGSPPHGPVLKRGRNPGLRPEFPGPEFPIWLPLLGSKVTSQGTGANTDALPPAQRPSSPFPRLLPGVPHARPPKCPLPPTSQRAVEKAGTRAARGVPASNRPGRGTKVRRQLPTALGTWDSLPGVRTRQPACSWGALRLQRKGVLLGATRGGGHRGLRISGPPEYIQGDRSTTLKKFPVQRAHLRSGGEAISPASTQPCPLWGASG